MIVALLVEAGLCFPRGARRRRSRGDAHERLPLADLAVDAGDGRAVDRRRAGRGRDLLRRRAPQSAIGRPTWRSEVLAVRHRLLAVLLFNQPEWIEEFRPEGKPSIAVLWDASPSMETRDVVRPGGSRSAPTTRREADRSADRSGIVERLARTIRRRPRAFFHAAARPRNRFVRAALGGAGQIPQPAGDRPGVGRRLERRQAPRAGGRPVCGKREFPCSRSPSAARRDLPDVEVAESRRADVRRRRQIGPHPVHDRQFAPPRIRDDGHAADVERRRTLEGSAHRPDGPHERFDPVEAEDRSATSRCTWTCPPNPDETLVDNNRRTAPISIREEKLKVLVVESYPRWEYRYLRNALSRDPGVEVSCLLFHPGLEQARRRQQGLHQAISHAARRTLQVRRRLSGRRRRGRRPVDRRAVPAAQRTGRTTGQRPGLHARLAGTRILAVRHGAGRPVSGGARSGTAQRMGPADAEPFRADRTRPPQPAHQTGRLARTTTPRSGRDCPASSGTPRCCEPRPAATCCACTKTSPTNSAGFRCW